MPGAVLIPPVLRGGVDTSRIRVHPQAGVDGESRVGGNERGVGPVCVDEAAVCGPRVRVPDAREDVHGLRVGEEVVGVVCVLVHPYRNVVDNEPVWILQSA